MRVVEPKTSISGPVMFARYALPPHRRGLCGPADAPLGEYLAAGTIDAGLIELVRGFDGAWPYLQLIASECRIRDPLDSRVVEAYWLGGRLSSGVDLGQFGNSLESRFATRLGWRGLADNIGVNGGAPTHAFHVFCVYPWLGLLRSGLVEPSLQVLDRCRIRWGRVITSANERITVVSQPLVFGEGVLGLGPETAETAVLVPGLEPPAPGSRVALHWDWVCGELNRAQIENLSRSNESALQLANMSLTPMRL